LTYQFSGSSQVRRYYSYAGSVGGGFYRYDYYHAVKYAHAHRELWLYPPIGTYEDAPTGTYEAVPVVP